LSSHPRPARAERRTHARRIASLAIVAALLFAASAGCSLSDAGQASSGRDEALLRLQTPASVWWTGEGSYAVLQAVGKDGRPTVTVWDRATGKLRTYPEYRVVSVEPHEPRFWVVPDSRVVPSSSHDKSAPHVVDIAGDGIDSRPMELYSVRLDEDGKPRSDVDARWHAWSGAGPYSVSVEIDVNRGACASTLRFSETGTSRNAWSAKVPTDVATFEPIGWSRSGLYFAVVTQADASATAEAVAVWTADLETAVADASTLSRAKGDAAVDIITPAPPTWDADVLVFSAADGALVSRREARMPILQPNSGASLAAWSALDTLLYLQQAKGRPVVSGVMPLTEIDMKSDPLALLSSTPPRFAWFAGADNDGLVVGRMAEQGGTEGDITVWRIGNVPNPLDLGPVPGSVTARWSPQGGMLSLAGPMSEPGYTVYLSKTAGGAPAKIISVGAE
jgi:hypothetical protein